MKKSHKPHPLKGVKKSASTIVKMVATRKRNFAAKKAAREEETKQLTLQLASGNKVVKPETLAQQEYAAQVYERLVQVHRNLCTVYLAMSKYGSGMEALALKSISMELADVLTTVKKEGFL